MKVTFYGAAQNVTGSKHLIETQNFKLLLDCGLYQGKRSEANLQNSTLPFLASQINAVILSHAHLDHCGTLPVLVKNGYQGKIYCTKATAEIAKYILLDAADLQKQDAKYYNKHHPEDQIEPIFTKQDVKKTLELFEPVEYFRNSNQWTQLNENVRFKFYDAGHILGSAVTLLEITENTSTSSVQVKTLAFTGDLGREESPILRSPEEIAENTENLITECTYGDRLHRPIAQATEDLKTAIDFAAQNKGKIIVPAFSLGRTQALIYILHKLTNEKIIPPLPIYLDSPLAENLTDIFNEFTQDFDQDFWQDFGNKGQSPFSMPNLFYVKSEEESKSLNEKQGPLMVIAGSGMLEGGRILHHLKNNIENKNNTILITGYQAENTLGRRIQEGVSPVKIYGQLYQVKAKVVTLNEFSAHADQNDLLNYILKIKNLKQVFLVHTELAQATAFKTVLQNSLPDLEIQIPTQNQFFEL